MRFLTDIKDAFLHLLFPQVCAGCGTDVLDAAQPLCLRCIDALPQTHFEHHANNPAAHLFWGRLPLVSASAQYYFTHHGLMQQLMHQFKYNGHKPLGLFLGRLMGAQLSQSTHFETVDALVPLPLFAAKERARGYNQATVVCEGIAETWPKPVWTNSVTRSSFTESQTTKSRIERWQNMKGRFEVTAPKTLEGKQLLLVDDVVTTGATLEACGRALLHVPGVKLSVATLCIAAD